MPITIISSLYRVEAHLPQFTDAVLNFAQAIHQAGIDVHYLPIVNDTSPYERSAIDNLSQRINASGYGKMIPHYTERETLYATWNRGIHLSTTPYFTFWNADDVRDVGAFIEGYRALHSGATLVDFKFTSVRESRRFGIFPMQVQEQSRMLFCIDPFTRKNGVGPFFMVNRSLYDTIGGFDESFRITGDLEWASRTLPYVNFYPAQQVGGYFYIHGDNLSNTGTNQEDIEVNIVFMRRQDWYKLIPVDPIAMRSAWDTWGNQDSITLPDEVADFLWDTSADARWRLYQKERKQANWMRRIRQALAARGLIHSAEWSVFQRNRNKRVQ